MYNTYIMKKQYATTVLKYNVIFEGAKEGGYTVTVPALPGCISEGDTFEKAKVNITDAINLYLEDLAESGEEIPSAGI